MFKLKKSYLCTILTIFLSLIFGGCTSKPISKNGIFLGTICKITIFDKASANILTTAYDRVSSIENEMTINKTSSEVISINSSSGSNYIKVSNDTFNVIKKSLYYSELSKGKFDISIGCVDKLWNIGTDKARIPSNNEIASKLPLVNYKNILLNSKDNSVMLKNSGMLIDLGAIAKGYAADEVKKVLKSHGIKHALINLGGNIVTLGNKPDDTQWTLGVQNPFDSHGSYMGTIKISEKSIVTSGIYERFLQKNGKRYHHILDTKTGYPVDNPLVSVSIIADNSIDADGLSTTVFSLGLNKGLKLIESIKNTEAIFITKNHDVYISSGLKNSFSIKSSDFKLKHQ